MSKTSVKIIKSEEAHPEEFYEVGSYFTILDSDDEEILLQLVAPQARMFVFIVVTSGGRWLEAEPYTGTSISRSQLIKHLAEGHGEVSTLKYLPKVVIRVPG